LRRLRCRARDFVVMSADGPPPSALISGYYDLRRIAEQVAKGNYRNLVGGKWDALGRLQRDFLVAEGLRPEHYLLDIGCGAFRGGVHAVAYLDPGHYFGVDISRSLIDAGYEFEIVPLGLASRLPRENLACNADFDFPWDAAFDYAIAQSLFTHLPFNLIRCCLDRLALKTRAGARFYATYHAVPDDADLMRPRVNKGRETHPGHDPYHYKFRDLAYACEELPWRVSQIPDARWLHPRQKIVCFERL
jgi:SAM-dependent methyltransferase